MFDFSILLNTEIQIITYFILGFILKKKGITDETVDSFLSIFIINLVMPINIFLSFYENVSLVSLQEGYRLILVGTIVAGIVYFISKLLPKSMDTQERKIIQYSMLISNGSLIGLPLIQGLFGSAGIFYANLFMIPTRILSFGLGDSFFNPNYQRKSLIQTMKSFLTNPITIAMILGILFQLGKISLFPSVTLVFNGLSSCMTPIALILVGSILATSFQKEISVPKSISGMCFFRLLLAPLITYMVCILLNLGSVQTIVAVLINAAPVASTCTIFAKRYNGNATFASNCVCYSTIASFLTLCGVCIALIR